VSAYLGPWVYTCDGAAMCGWPPGAGTDPRRGAVVRPGQTVGSCAEPPTVPAPDWGAINRRVLAEVAAHGSILPGSVAERQACKGLVRQGKLEPNGCMGYRLAAPESLPISEYTGTVPPVYATGDRVVLVRQDDPRDPPVGTRGTVADGPRGSLVLYVVWEAGPHAGQVDMVSPDMVRRPLEIKT
jgi:hypothetical protein